jgi:Cu(I)/Ag(I) efflux system membrane protein CusA/SilA
VEDQVTYPLSTTMMSVPGAKTVRGYSMFGDSFVYILFEDGTDPYLGALACARIPEPGAVALAAGAKPALGPMRPAWAGSTSTPGGQNGQHDLGQLRALQDWFLRYELKSVPDCRRGRIGRRHGPPVPDRALSRNGCAPTAFPTAA